MWLVVLLILLWLMGAFSHVGGNLIHILLVVALVVFIINNLGGWNWPRWRGR